MSLKRRVKRSHLRWKKKITKAFLKLSPEGQALFDKWLEENRPPKEEK